MSGRQIANATFLTLLARTLRCAVEEVRIVRHLARPYSDVWFVHARTRTGDWRVVAKSWSNPEAFQKQVRVLQLAKATCADRGDICIPYLGSDADERLLFMQEVFDPTVKQLCGVSLRRLWEHWGVFHPQRDLTTACRHAGCWLRDWHEKTMDWGPLSPLFEAYLANREDCTGLLDSQDRKALHALVESLRAGVLCVPHGDFTPPNILWSLGRLTVLDFGVSEWNRMTPWWDRVAMKIGLFRALKFGSNSLGLWIPALPSAATNAFREGYGDGTGTPRARLACWAIRHLTFYADDVRKGPRYRRRAAWHWLEFQRALSEAKTGRHMVPG